MVDMGDHICPMRDKLLVRGRLYVLNFKDTLKRAVKAGDGIILATSPPYSRLLDSGVDFAIVSEVMPHCDKWVQEFLRHEIPCMFPDYLVTMCANLVIPSTILYNTTVMPGQKGHPRSMDNGIQYEVKLPVLNFISTMILQNARALQGHGPSSLIEI